MRICRCGCFCFSKGVFHMEWNEKLQLLRKQRGLTQEELAQALFVSRTAISKWESGRGYPNIDSLKAISRFFSVTIDELLSGEEMLIIAEEGQKQNEKRFCTLLLGLLDCTMALFFVLPFFRQQTQAVSFAALTDIQPFLKAAYLAVILLLLVWGVAELALQSWQHPWWGRYQSWVSLCLSTAGVLLFIISQQPYAAVFAFVLLMVKAWMALKQR